MIDPAMAVARQRAFEDLAKTTIGPLAKGFPPGTAPLALGDIGRQGWSVLAGDLTMPVAVLRQSALSRNRATMRRFLAANRLAIAPHGKTTMAPQIYAMQIEDGAWGITVATVHQFAVCRRFHIDRILIANQLTGAAEIDYVFAELAEAPDLEVHVLVDSIEGVERLAAGGRRRGALERLNVLVEVGAAGGRTGCRTLEEAMAVARAAVTAGLVLRGVEGFEGILGDVAAIDAFLDRIVETAGHIAAEGMFAPGLPVIVSAGGSAWYDRVAARCETGRRIGPEVTILARSGCYVTHDSGVYAEAVAALGARGGPGPEDYEPALLVFSHVQSRPEPGKAILAMGRRDVGTDAGLPVPLLAYRPGRDPHPVPMPPGCELTALNDQHAHLACPGDGDLAVGDLVAFGISHPCTTFDKWQVLFVVDDDWRVVDAVRTFF